MLTINTSIQRFKLIQIAILKKLNHPNIIKCLDSFVENEKLYIVMEYAEKGTPIIRGSPKTHQAKKRKSRVVC
jgi:serine/threonine protein kinase